MSKKNTSKNKNTKTTKKNNISESLEIKKSISEQAQNLETAPKTEHKNTNSKKEILSKPKGSISEVTNKFNNEIVRERINAVLYAIVGFALVAGFAYYLIPTWVNQTDEAQLQREREELEEQTRIDAEKAEQESKKLQETLSLEQDILVFENQSVNLKTNQGDLTIDLSYSTAPKNVENFVRLTYRKTYDNTIIHRMVKTEGFNIIQGGDPSGTGTNSESATKGILEDEIWEVEPTFSETGELNNEPKLREPALINSLDLETGTVVYPKGTIVMANTGQPDSAGSQFFIVLSDSRLPAQYTPFGKVKEENFDILDKILNEFNPVIEDGKTESDGGIPDKEIRIESVNLIVPNRR
jgi:cyclophilin family peptidyl-prolyl cis-trans isomerase